MKPEFNLNIDWSHPNHMCYHNTNWFVADDVIMLLQTARLKKIHHTLILSKINIINALLAMDFYWIDRSAMLG